MDHDRLVRIRTVTIGLCIAAGFLTLSLVLLHYIKFSVRYAYENDSLRRELRQASERLETLNESLASIEESSFKLEHMSRSKVDDLRNRIRLPRGDAAEALDSAHSSRWSWPDVTSDDAAAELTVLERLNQAVINSTLIMHKLDSLSNTIADRRKVVGSIPTLLPVKGVISSGFGTRRSPFTGKNRFHKGIDIVAENGDTIYAAADGVVVFSGWASAFGKNIVVDHGYGIRTRYAHSSKLLVEKGALVRRGQPIAEVGSTGRSTGSHVHYEVWVNGKTVNPEPFLLELPSEVHGLASLGNESMGPFPLTSTVDVLSESENLWPNAMGGEIDPLLEDAAGHHGGLPDRLFELLDWERKLHMIMFAGACLLAAVIAYLSTYVRLPGSK